MSDGNYNNLRRAERAYGDVLRMAFRAKENGEDTEQLDVQLAILKRRVDNYKALA